jgi:hypothetical protein
MLWHEIDFTKIKKVPGSRGGYDIKYNDEPLKFQIPLGRCNYGFNEFTNDRGNVMYSMNIDYASHPSFQNWFGDLEDAIGAPEPFVSNFKDDNLRVKIEETTLIMNWVQQVENVNIQEGTLRDCELLAIIEIPSVYYFKEQYGLTIRASQIRYKYEPRETKFLFSGIL